jgi:putative two-component system response regulator
MMMERMPAILVVDDEDTIRRVITRVLTRGGYKDVVTANSSEEARILLGAKEFDLMLTDMQMPGGSGLDLLARVRIEQPFLAILMVTGSDDPGLAEEVLSLGAYGYMIKPFKNNELLINVSNALRRRDLEIENKAHRDGLEDLVRERTKELWATINHLEAAEKDLLASRTETIHRLALAAEYRDEETGHHIERMSHYCELLARAAGVDEDLCSTIREASSLHDVGKIGIPDNILLKPGSLTRQERAVIETHAEIGHRILIGSESPLLQLAATIALTHHEQIDGSGYPNGLSGEEIPVAGRIAAIADVFDALTTNRPYRRAFAIGVAAEMMKKEAGTHFDPELLEVFWGILPEVLAVKEERDSAAFGTGRRSAPLGLEWEKMR